MRADSGSAAGGRCGVAFDPAILILISTVTIKSVDLRANTFVADVNIYGTAKESTFFPVGTTLDKAKEYIKAAWKDACTYGSCRGKVRSS